jgi:hypothetical protein
LLLNPTPAVASCNANIAAGNPKTIVARMKCLNDAMTIRMPLFGNDQDLALAFMADRMVVAERVQNGKMTLAEGDAAIAEKWSAASAKVRTVKMQHYQLWRSSRRQRHKGRLLRQQTQRHGLR